MVQRGRRAAVRGGVLLERQWVGGHDLPSS